MRYTDDSRVEDSLAADPRSTEPCTLAALFAQRRDEFARRWRGIAAQARSCAMAHETLHTIESGSLEQLQRELADFIVGLRRRIRTEEPLLGPIERTTRPIPEFGPAVQLRSEHRRLETSATALEKALDAHTCAVMIEAVENENAGLTALLYEHGESERRFFGEADRVLPASEVKTLVRALGRESAARC
jgi:hypothetical protein